MANPKLEVRLPPIMHAYLEDLASIGLGRGKSGVARRYIENAVDSAIAKGQINSRNASEFNESDDEKS